MRNYKLILEFDDFHDSKKLWHYIPVYFEVLDYLFDSVKGKSEYNFVELGSGEGRNCFYAANFFKKSYGVEIFDEYYDKSIEIQNAGEKIKLHKPGNHEQIDLKHSRLVDNGILSPNVTFIKGDILSRNIINKIPKEKSVVFTYQPFKNAMIQNEPIRRKVKPGEGLVDTERDKEKIEVRKNYDRLIKSYVNHFPSGTIFYFHECYLRASNFEGLGVKPYLPMIEFEGGLATSGRGERGDMKMNGFIKI